MYDAISIPSDDDVEGHVTIHGSDSESGDDEGEDVVILGKSVHLGSVNIIQRLGPLWICLVARLSVGILLHAGLLILTREMEFFGSARSSHT